MNYVDPDHFIKDWVAALKSGDYPQTTGKLHRPEGFCCLGVACDLYARKSGEEYWLPMDECYYEFRDPDTGVLEENGLPESIYKDLLGLTVGENLQELPIPLKIIRRHAPDIETSVDSDEGDTFITHVNDQGYSFTVIADIIEDWWKEKKETA